MLWWWQWPSGLTVLSNQCVLKPGTLARKVFLRYHVLLGVIGIFGGLLVIITGVLGVALLADGSTGLIILMNEGENPLWPVSMTELVLGAVSAFGFHGLYNRKPEGARPRSNSLSITASERHILRRMTASRLCCRPRYHPRSCHPRGHRHSRRR